jgi:hypothetical protein
LAIAEIDRRSHRAWESLYAEERVQKAATREKAEREKELKEYREEQRRFFQELGGKIGRRSNACRRRNGSARRPVRRKGREREKGLLRQRQQKNVAIRQENDLSGLSNRSDIS